MDHITKIGLADSIVRVYDPRHHTPRPSDDDPSFSVDVFILDKSGMHGLGYYDFEMGEWCFHTDWIDYGDSEEKNWVWYYPVLTSDVAKTIFVK